MASTFIGIEMGKKSLITEQTAMKTTGHNIANANTEGYTRQRVTLESEIPLDDPGLNRDQRPGQIGQGVQVERIERIRDNFIDDRVIDETSGQGYWKTRNDYLYNIEMIHNEPDDKNIRSLMDQYWNSLEELANNPSESSVREVVRERAETLTKSINNTWRRLSNVQHDIDWAVKDKVAEVNQTAESIRQLNVQILRSENVGDRPNDLYDRRDLLVEKLSKIVNITVNRSDPDEFMVFIGSVHLVQGDHREEIVTRENPAKRGFVDLFWEKKIDKTGDDVLVRTGELASLLELRDHDLDYQLRQLDSLAVNMSDLVNEIHRGGFDLNNNTNLDFFRKFDLTRSANGDFDVNNDGTPEITAVFKAAGTKVLNPDAEIGVAGTITLDSNVRGGAPVTVGYVATDKVRDVVKKINQSQAEVVAYLTQDNRLAVKAGLSLDKQNNPDFVIRHLQDDPTQGGGFLVATAGVLNAAGAAGAYDWRTPGQMARLAAVPGPAGETPRNVTITPMYDPGSWMDVAEGIKLDTRSIAAARGTDLRGQGYATASNGPGDGSNALAMASLKHRNTMIGENETFNDFYTSVISRTGVLAEQAEVQVKTADKLMEQLTQLRQSVSGVSLDEEMANLIMYQHAYNAAARFVTVQDRMLETIIRMGL